MKNPLMTTYFTLSEIPENFPQTFNEKGKTDRYKVKLQKQDYLFGMIPWQKTEVVTDIYDDFDAAKNAVIARRRDNAATDEDKKTRSVFGAVMGFAYNRMLANMSCEAKKTLNGLGEMTDAITDIKGHFRTVYATHKDPQANSSLRRSVFQLFD